jgi:hypothetical protein
MRCVKGASFAFKYKAFSKEVGKSLLDFFSDIPLEFHMKTGYKSEENSSR